MNIYLLSIFRIASLNPTETFPMFFNDTLLSKIIKRGVCQLLVLNSYIFLTDSFICGLISPVKEGERKLWI